MDLNEQTFQLFAAKAYTNPSCQSIEEFEEDLAHIVHIKKLLTKYASSGEIKTRLLVNHLISIFNVFENIAAIQMLFFRIPTKHHKILKTLLKALDRCPDVLKIGEELNIKDILIDSTLLNKITKDLEIIS